MGTAASDAVERALEGGEGPDLILSAGFCGGLVPSLRPGKIVLAKEIHHRGETIPLDVDLFDRAKDGLSRGGVDFTTGAIESVDRIIESVAKKRDLGEEGAIAVEMEDGSLALLARERGIGFLSVRAVIDPVDRALPFSSDRSLVRSILDHPIATLRFAWFSFLAGRAIGRAIPAVVDAFDGGTDES
jgi:adenosylhomocysteine nucleosidase